VSTKQEQRREEWRQRVGEQESSGQSILAFCRERGLNEQVFYGWRRRLRKQDAPVRFALVERKSAAETAPPIELMLPSGDRLRIPNDAATLKMVLAVLREQA
jgi:transposase-like protein